MSKSLIINSQNYVAGSGNKYQYNFPTEMSFKSGDKIGLSQISIYNSSFNITSALQNNTYSIVWNANTQSTFNITIPNSYMSVSDLNYYIQSQCIANNLYVTSNNGSDYVYFVEVVVNAPLYAAQINCYPLPTSAQATTLGYSMPSNATWSYPTTATCPQFVISSGLGTLLGFTNQTVFPPNNTFSSAQQYLSNTSPIVSPVNSYILTCNLLNSKYAIPNNVFYSVSLGNAVFGAQIILTNSNIIYNDISPQKYNSIIITILDQNFNSAVLNDYEVVIVLSILEA